MKQFTLEISTTQKCNLGCPYCYVANRDLHMTKESFDEALPKIIELMQRSGTTDLICSFFGGEPMLNWELIEHATKRLQSLPLDVKLVIISNMTMITQERVDWVLENNVGISWSFDGMGSNESRPLLPVFENKNADGNHYNGILDMYKDKIDMIKQVTNGCKVMIWPGNMHEMASNLDFFVDMGITGPDYSLVRDDVWTEDDLRAFKGHLRDLGDKYISYLEQGKYIEVGFFTLTMLDNILGLTFKKREHSCFAGTYGAVLMHDGSFYPCARFASKDMMKIDENYDFSYWQDQLNPANYDKCKSCDLYSVCNTGCSYSQIRNDNKPLDSICELFHMLQEETQRVVEVLKDNPTFQNVIVNNLKGMG